MEYWLIKKFRRLSSSEAKLLEQHKKAEIQEKLNREEVEKFEQESKVPGSYARTKTLEADYCINAEHVAGLPISEGTETYIYRGKDKVIFERNQDTFELDIKKVRDILLKTDVEIQKSYVSSAGGAIGGYALFGPLGALIGGRSKEKQSKIEEKYLIFSYEKDGELDFISFNVTKEPKAIFFINHYDLSSQERRTQVL
ncbi:hypothetical protein ACQKMD_11225 [Viridibacillus sp. NPDC096237]|uniref:hypothetical protein n=1 Tax=Viridibacillus sp. NPDC096237 TaxID=3390721 RepID=UPI003CFC6EFB